MELKYMSGFGNQMETEAIAGALPVGQNSPQKPPHGLYPEQLTGTAFTAPRSQNLRSWLYKIRPSVVMGEMKPLAHPSFLTAPLSQNDPNQLRWKPLPYPKEAKDWFESLTTYCANGTPGSAVGVGVHLYACTKSMEAYHYSADGDYLIVPQEGRLLIKTEMGWIDLSPSEIAVIPRGIKFKIELLGEKARGYVAENYGNHFVIPDLGPIGANGLAAPRDFLAPVAAYEDKDGACELIVKYQGLFFRSQLSASPLDVVAWHGNYYPYKYDLKRFNVINTVSFDHPDPSIFTVLTSPSGAPGVANLDFVIFPPRWMVAEHTFRPPYYHRNVMSEFMGLIEGVYDAKSDDFAPGGASLHNAMSPHGPDAGTFQKATNSELKPERYQNTLAFMFESRWPFALSEQALKSAQLDRQYLSCWQGLKKEFKP